MKKGMMKAIIISLLLFLSPFTTNGMVFRDHAGRNVSIENAPSRIVSLAPSITELIFAIGQGERVVGVTRYCNYPPQTSSIAKVGGMLDPDFERILLLKPDIVMISKEGSRRDVVSRLESLGIKTFILGSGSISGILDSIRVLGKITNSEDKSEALINELIERIESIRKQSRGLRRIRVLFLIWERPMIAVGGGTFIDEMIELAGGLNVARNGITRYPRLSREDILRMNPEVIILTGDLNGRDISGEDGSLLKMVDAVKDGRVYRVNPDYYERPGTRFIEGVEELFRILHGRR